MSRWHLEAITPADIDAIVSIDQVSFQHPWHRNLFLEELSCNDGYSYMVKCNQVENHLPIIAYVSLRISLNEVHIIRIAVKAKFRSLGIATWLLNKCFQLARKKGADSVHIEVRPSNETAIALYRKLGFCTIGKRPDYYPDTGEEACVMKKQLKERL
jgi:ribosomal-protein-alanine N-acetyltransferase